MSSPRSVDAQAVARWLRRFARTTPGVVSLLAFIVAVGCVIAGVVCADQLNGRIAQRNAVLERSEPLAYSAQNLYAALSAADAAAASAFLSGGIETPQMRMRYQQALADAAGALADTTAGTTDADTRAALGEIAAQLSAYTGLIESARANNRQGFPIGSGYLREASTLMQNTLLPGAEQIYAGHLAALDDDQRAIGSVPIAGVVLLVLVLAAIGVGSAVLYRRTNRQFNIGLLAAAAAVLLALGWIVVAIGFAAGSIEDSRDSTERFAQLAQARILAQQARTDETLQLIARGGITASEESFHGRIDELLAHLDSASAGPADGVQRWTASHRVQVQAYEDGDYPAAVAQAIGADPQASAVQFDLVESGLRDEIEQARGTLRERVAQAGSRLAFSPTGVLVLMVAAAAAAVGGLWPRLKEFL